MACRHVALAEQQLRLEPKPSETTAAAAAVLPAIASVLRAVGGATDGAMPLDSVSLPPLPTAAMCLLVRGEQHALDEWVSYHLGLGFRAVYIFDNESPSKPEAARLDRWARLAEMLLEHFFPGQRDERPVEIVVERWNDHSSSRQARAYNHCVKSYAAPRHDDWVAFFDIDEFLVLKNHRSVPEFLRDHAPVRGSVAINWLMFGTSNRTHRHIGAPITWQFQVCNA